MKKKAIDIYIEMRDCDACQTPQMIKLFIDSNPPANFSNPPANLVEGVLYYVEDARTPQMVELSQKLSQNAEKRE